MKRIGSSLLFFTCACVTTAAGFTACGSEEGDVPPASAEGSADDANVGATGDAGDADAGSVVDGDVDCGLVPKIDGSASLRCPDLDGGATGNCASGLRCCQPPLDASEGSTCADSCPTGPDGGPYPGVVWECQGPAHCAALDAGGDICCGVGGVELDEACGFLRSRVFRGTTCKTACASNEFVVCREGTPCPTNLVCKPLKARGIPLGACLPP